MEGHTENDLRLIPGDDAEVIQKYPTLFGNVKEKNVTFCIDTSGSMYKCLDAIKDDIKKTLLKLSLEPNTHFNLVEFSTNVSQWADSLVECTPETVMLAQEWIDKLEAKTGTNALDALLISLKDPSCEAVYFVTDGLPDQNPNDVLDYATEIAGNRPVHCYYIESGTTDPQAIDFLQDLAIETFGSFHIVCITQHGAVESITPVYRAEASGERIIRTTSGNVYPASYAQPGVLVESVPTPFFISERDYWPSHTTGYYAYPHIGHYYYCYPQTGWSRYRPARSWMKTAEQYIDIASVRPRFVPGAGGVLIDKTVLARKKEDGLYYLGKVRSQLHEDQFLVEFSPCKHSEFKKTLYQETYVYDIISFDDAQRHSILPGDKVLAPWEPESIRYGPGVVVEGQEKRLAEVGISDKDVTVGFFNGYTLKIPSNTAVWVPPDLHDRITFELKLPAKVRMEMADGIHKYPYEAVPGYPSTGSSKSSLELDTFEPLLLESHPGYYERGLYRKPHFVPLYKQRGAYFSEPPGYKESDRVIPGTELTESQLNEKVMNQLLMHRMVSDDHPSRLLSKRRQVEDSNRLRRSVTFDDTQLTDLEAEEMRDSGRGSDPDLEEAELDDLLRDSDQERRDAASRVGSGRFRRKTKPRKSEDRPAWKYCKKESIPELLESNHYGPNRLGPFKESALAKPMKSMEKFGSWSTSMSNFFNRYENDVMGDRSASVRDSLGYLPQPPDTKVPVRDTRTYRPRSPDDKHKGPRLDIEICFSKGRTDDEARLQARNDFRKRQILERHERMSEKREDELRRTEAMRDKHRERIVKQIEFERTRESRHLEIEQQQREAKTVVRHEIRQRVEEKQRSEEERKDVRLSQMMQAKQQRAETQNQKREEEKQQTIQREQARREKTHQHIVSQIQKAEEVERQELVQDIAKQNAKINRIEHFRALEDRAQAMKQLNSQVTDQNNQIYRSQTLL